MIVEDLQYSEYTVADFFPVILDCLDRWLPSLHGDFVESQRILVLKEVYLLA